MGLGSWLTFNNREIARGGSVLWVDAVFVPRCAPGDRARIEDRQNPQFPGAGLSIRLANPAGTSDVT
jgi:hypothetical protein